MLFSVKLNLHLYLLILLPHSISPSPTLLKPKLNRFFWVLLSGRWPEQPSLHGTALVEDFSASLSRLGPSNCKKGKEKKKTMISCRLARQTVGTLCKRVNRSIHSGPQACRENSVSVLIQDKKGSPISNYVGGYSALGILVRRYSSESSMTKSPPAMVSNNSLDMGSPVRFPRMEVGQGLSRCVILQFPKRTFVQFFLPRRQRQRWLAKSGPGKGFWTFREVKPIRCLHSRNATEEQNEVKDQGAGKKVESVSFSSEEKENDVRTWKKMQQSSQIKKNLSKLIQISGAFKHPKNSGLVNDTAIVNNDPFRKTKLYRFLNGTASSKAKKSNNNTRTSQPFRRARPASRPMLNYSVMQYISMTEKQLLR